VHETDKETAGGFFGGKLGVYSTGPVALSRTREGGEMGALKGFGVGVGVGVGLRMG